MYYFSLEFLRKLEAHDPAIKVLKFSHELTDLEMEFIAIPLKSQDTHVTSLILKGRQITTRGIKHLAAMLKENKTITTLDLSDNDLDTEGIEALVEGLKENTTLQTLDLSATKINNTGILVLVEALKKNPNLQKLNLSFNRISALGANDLARLLIESKLRQLIITNNQLGDEGVAILEEALKENKFLTILNLRLNQIGNLGACALARVLVENRGILSVLRVDYNLIGPEGVDILRAAARWNGKIKSVCLLYNPGLVVNNDSVAPVEFQRNVRRRI